MANFQLSTARTSLGNLLRDISDIPDDTFIQWCNFIGIEAYHFFLGIDPTQFLKSASYTAVTGTQALPAKFDGIQYDGCGFWELNDDGTQSDRRLSVTCFGSQETGFYIDGNNVVFTGLDESKPVTLRYAPGWTQYTALTDYFTVGGLTTDPEVIPLDHMEVVVNGLHMFWTRWDEDTMMEPVATQRWITSLNDLANHTRRLPQSYAYPDSSGMY